MTEPVGMQKSRPCLCYYADCWGFTARVMAAPEATFLALRDLHQHVSTLIARDTSVHTHCFTLSDSLFIVVPLTSTPAQNGKCFSYLVRLVELITVEGFRLGLPLRGSFSVGDLYTEATCLVGAAVSEAVRLGDSLRVPLPVIARHSILKGITSGLLPGHLLSTDQWPGGQMNSFLPIPTKNHGLILGHPALYQRDLAVQVRADIVKLRESNDISLAPVPIVASALRTTEELLDTWIAGLK